MFKKTLIFSLLFLQFQSFAKTQIFLSDQSHRQDIQQALRVDFAESSQRWHFSLCQVTSAVSGGLSLGDCQVIGREQGYKAAEIDQQITQMERTQRRRLLAKTAYITLMTVGGFFAGGETGYSWAQEFHKADMYAHIGGIFTGVVVGSVGGLMISSLTRHYIADWMAGSLNDEALDVLSRSEEAKKDEVHVIELKSSMQKFSSEMQAVLMAIPGIP